MIFYLCKNISFKHDIPTYTILYTTTYTIGLTQTLEK